MYRINVALSTLLILPGRFLPGTFLHFSSTLKCTILYFLIQLLISFKEYDTQGDVYCYNLLCIVAGKIESSVFIISFIMYYYKDFISLLDFCYSQIKSVYIIE